MKTITYEWDVTEFGLAMINASWMSEFLSLSSLSDLPLEDLEGRCAGVCDLMADGY